MNTIYTKLYSIPGVRRALREHFKQNQNATTVTVKFTPQALEAANTRYGQRSRTPQTIDDILKQESAQNDEDQIHQQVKSECWDSFFDDSSIFRRQIPLHPTDEESKKLLQDLEDLFERWAQHYETRAKQESRSPKGVAKSFYIRFCFWRLCQFVDLHKTILPGDIWKKLNAKLPGTIAGDSTTKFKHDARRSYAYLRYVGFHECFHGGGANARTIYKMKDEELLAMERGNGMYIYIMLLSKGGLV